MDTHRLKRFSNKLLFLGVGLTLMLSALLPAMLPRKANAAQMTSRSITLSSGRPSQASVTYTYGFTTITSSTIQSIEFEACTTAIGTCTAPTGMTINAGTEASRSGWNTTTPTTFARNATGGGGCTPAANVLCLDRIDADSETAGARTLGWNTQTNPSTANSTFFIRITLYSDSAWATTTDTGTVAGAVAQTLTINAAVAEILNFCVGATTVNDATTSVAADCTGVSGTNVNVGTLDTGFVNVSPISAVGGDNENGVAMVRSNAVNGTTVSYYAIQQSGTNHLGTLRVSGAVCDAGATLTDQCINAAGTTHVTLTAGTERFGMAIAGVNCGSNSDAAYTCDFATSAYNLLRDANYDGNQASNGYVSDAGQVSGTTSGSYSWEETTTIDQIATSTGSTVKAIEDEALILKFAATPSITTPTGSYTALVDFVALATY